MSDTAPRNTWPPPPSASSPPPSAPRRFGAVVGGVAVLGVAAAVLVGAVVLRPRLIHVPSRSMEPVLPGERFQIVGGVVHVNGRRLDEPYVAPENRDDKNHGPFQVPVGQYYVMGDNRRDAADSRYLGAIERDRIWGKWVRW